jgi:hypothetical protein
LPDVAGYSANYESLIDDGTGLPEERYYETRFLASVPGVEEEATQPLEAKVDDHLDPVYEIHVPNDLFTVYSYEEI